MRNVLIFVIKGGADAQNTRWVCAYPYSTHADTRASYGRRGESSFRIGIFVNIRHGQRMSSGHGYGRRGESNFRIGIFGNIRHGQKDELGARCPELILLTVPYIHEYFYTKTRFSTAALSALSGPVRQICLS